MRRSAKSIEPQCFFRRGLAIGPISNQSRAQKRGDVKVGNPFRKGDSKIRSAYSIFCKPSIDLITRIGSIIAEIFFVLHAIAAVSAAAAQPWHSDALSFVKSLNAAPSGLDDPD